MAKLEKICGRCKKKKDISEFHKNSTRPDGLQSYCKLCVNTATSQWRKDNPEAARRIYRRAKYKLSPEEYDAMYLAQDGRCAACRRKCKTGRELAVDHDHKTERVRGLLCMGCNTALGSANDDPEVLRALAAYAEFSLLR